MAMNALLGLSHARQLKSVELLLTQCGKSLNKVLIMGNYYVLLSQKRLEATEIIPFYKQNAGAHS